MNLIIHFSLRKNDFSKNKIVYYTEFNDICYGINFKKFFTFDSINNI